MSKIEPDSPVILPEMLDSLKRDESNWYRFDVNSLLKLDPTGKHVIPALTEVVANLKSHDTEAVRALMLYGKNARPALPAVLAASNEDRIGGGLVVDFLWSLSAWDVVRYSFHSYEGTILVALGICVLCLIVECVWFRWRLWPRASKSGTGLHTPATAPDVEEWARNLATSANAQFMPKPSDENSAGSV